MNVYRIRVQFRDEFAISEFVDEYEANSLDEAIDDARQNVLGIDFGLQIGCPDLSDILDIEEACI